MKTITIGFSKPKNKFFPVFSWLIRLYQWTPYSHVYLKFRSESLDRNLVYESVFGGVRFVGEKIWKEKAKTTAEFKLDVSDASYTSILQYCVDHAGMPYAGMQNLGLVIANLLNLDENPFKSGINCSEAIANILILNGKSIDKCLDLVTPKDIFDILDKK